MPRLIIPPSPKASLRALGFLAALLLPLSPAMLPSTPSLALIAGERGRGEGAIETCQFSIVNLQSSPDRATVRIKSHGASATVIATTNGKSWILGCAHMLADDKGNPSPALRAKKFYIDGPDQPHAIYKTSPGPARLVAWDYQADLSLLVIDNCHHPRCPAGHLFPLGRFIVSRSLRFGREITTRTAFGAFRTTFHQRNRTA